MPDSDRNARSSRSSYSRKALASHRAKRRSLYRSDMPVCQFGERQYELAANLELLAGAGSFFTPTTAMEEHLGVDVAMTPGDPRIWRLLGVRPPGGVTAGPSSFAGWPTHTPAATTPPFLVSLFLQYKRSTELTRDWANEWPAHHRPYWRVELSSRQHGTLRSLETVVGSQAVVRYAAPKFWRHDDMWRLQGAGAVLDNSLFFAPSEAGPRHTRLTWSTSVGLVGHSEHERLRGEAPPDVAREVAGRARDRSRPASRREQPAAHLATLASALEDVTPSRRRRDDWRDEIYAAPERAETIADQDAVVVLADMALIAEAATAARVSWIIVAVSERAPG